jgi:FkbM family methyltransferase
MTIDKFKNIIKKCETFLIIGAEKGDYTDDYYLLAENIKYCILIEPLHCNILKLKEKFLGSKYHIIECAVTPENKVYKMITPIDKNHCFLGSSSLLINERNNLRKSLQNKSEIIEVEGKTIKELKPTFNLLDFDYIQIDTEGSDENIFFQLINNNIKFKNIIIESMWLNKEEKNNIYCYFKNNNYFYKDDGCNIIASNIKFYD